MAWAFAIGMVITGSINTLATKWADRQSAAGCTGGNNPAVHEFSHPFLQAVGMFIGEFSCLIAFWIWRSWQRLHVAEDEFGNQDFNRLILFIPAMCDMTATSLMYIGLNYTYASSFQMLRGVVIVFTALLSVAFLRRSITKLMWSGIACVILGLLLVGFSDVLFAGTGGNQYGKYEIITGDLLIIIAQIIVACQVTIEEMYVNGMNIHPLQVVGWEGFFGMVTLGTLLFPMYFISTGETDGHHNRLEDALDGLCQLGHNWKVALGTLGSIASIAFFNFFGVSVTQHYAATTRMVLDSIRTVVIWAVSLALLWKSFQYLQVIGCAVLIIGTAVYTVFASNRVAPLANDEADPLLQEEIIPYPEEQVYL